MIVIMRYLKRLTLLGAIMIVCLLVSYHGICEDLNALSAKLQFNRIFILDPLITYENVRNESQILNVEEKQLNRIVNQTVLGARKNVSQADLDTQILQNLSESDKNVIAGSCANLRDNAKDLLKKWKSRDAFLNDFSTIKQASQCDAVFVPIVSVKVGRGGSWDFMYTGSIMPGTNTTTMKAAVIDLSSGEIVWSNKAIYRSLPDNISLKSCLKDLFKTFPGYKREKRKSRRGKGGRR